MKAKLKAIKEEALAAAEGTECPEWQNPLHHNNPDMNKIMIDDFEPGEEIPFAPVPPPDDGSGKVQAPPHIRELADEIVNLSMLEVNELATRLKEHFGFDDEDEMVGQGGEQAEGGEAAEEEAKEEKTAFDLKLTGFDAKAKIKIIKEVRGMTSLGLKEAKELVEGAPKVIKSDIKMEEAEELKKKLEEVGATVEIV